MRENPAAFGGKVGTNSKVRTRLELLLRIRQVPPSRLARSAHYTRQYLLNIRLGGRPSHRCQTTLLSALQELTGDSALELHEVFESPGASIASLLPRRRGPQKRRLRRQIFVETVAGLSDTAAEAWTAAILVTLAVHTETTIRTLLDTAEALLDRSPVRADQLYRTAIGVEKMLGDTPPLLRSALRGYALKGRANALRMLGLYREAVPFLTDAEQSFLDAQFCAVDVGHVLYGRATILTKMERWVEAEAAAQHAYTLLKAERDRRGALRAQLLRACILVEQGALDQARALLLSLRKPFEQVKDRDALARLWMNLAVCDLRRREPSIARHWLNRAIEAFRARGMRSEIIRARWCGAKVTLLEDERPKALRELRSAMREFEKLQMPLDAGFVSLDLLAELVGNSTTDAEAKKVARARVDLFTRAGVVVSAAYAAQMLRDAVVEGSVTREYVAYTNRYIARSFVFPGDSFEPPSRGRG